MAEYFNTPVITDKLSISAPQINNNFLQLNTSFTIDHYPYANAVATNGFHNQVTTPSKGTTPASDPVTVSNPIFFAGQPSSNLGVIQFSKGPNAAVSTPVTSLQSSSGAVSIGAGVTINIFDFTGLSRAICYFSAIDTNTQSYITNSVFYTGAAAYKGSGFSSGFTSSVSGSIFQLRNSSSGGYTSVYWTLQFLRLS